MSPMFKIRLTTDHPVVILSRALKGGSNDRPDRSECNGLDTAKLITKPASNETADEGTQVINGNLANQQLYQNISHWKTYDATLQKSVLDVGTTIVFSNAQLHGILVIIGGIVHATHHTLVITEEEDGKTSDTVDQNQKTTLLILVHHIVFADGIHRDGTESLSSSSKQGPKTQ